MPYARFELKAQTARYEKWIGSSSRLNNKIEIGPGSWHNPAEPKTDFEPQGVPT